MEFSIIFGSLYSILCYCVWCFLHRNEVIGKSVTPPFLIPGCVFTWAIIRWMDTSCFINYLGSHTILYLSLSREEPRPRGASAAGSLGREDPWPRGASTAGSLGRGEPRPRGASAVSIHCNYRSLQRVSNGALLICVPYMSIRCTVRRGERHLWARSQESQKLSFPGSYILQTHDQLIK